MMAQKTYKVIIAGGGTGGHVFPAIAIAQALRETLASVEILFVGAKGKLEMSKVPEAGFPIIGLPISGFQRSLSLRNLSFPFKVFYSLVRSFLTVWKFKPDIAIGVGGYASGPLLFAASRCGVPTLIQEQNSYPGVTNKILAKRASRICVAYDEMDQFFDADKIVVTGNPVRKIITTTDSIDPSLAKRFFGFNTHKPLILAIGGSLGARTINESLYAGLAEFNPDKVQLLWQCGSLYYDEFNQKINSGTQPHVLLKRFISEMDMAYAAADIIISRAGALSISELCLVGKPVILVPSPNVAEDHQTKNAMSLVSKDAAILVKDSEAVATLAKTAMRLLEDIEHRTLLADNIKHLGYTEAPRSIVTEIVKIIEGN